MFSDFEAPWGFCCYFLIVSRKMATIANVSEEIAKCEKLLANKPLMMRLPDKGAKVARRLEALKQQQQTKKQTAMAEEEEETRKKDPIQSRQPNEQQQLFEVALIDNAYRRQLGDKYRNDRVDIKKELCKGLCNLVSQKEIDRLVQDNGKLMMTWDETERMLDQETEREREKEILQLKQAMVKRKETV